MDSVSQLLSSENQKVVNIPLYRGRQMYPMLGRYTENYVSDLKDSFSCMWPREIYKQGQKQIGL